MCTEKYGKKFKLDRIRFFIVWLFWLGTLFFHRNFKPQAEKFELISGPKIFTVKKNPQKKSKTINLSYSTWQLNGENFSFSADIYVFTYILYFLFGLKLWLTIIMTLNLGNSFANRCMSSPSEKKLIHYHNWYVKMIMQREFHFALAIARLFKLVNLRFEVNF